MVIPQDAGIGAAPASIANAASERIRPGWDQAIRTWAAVRAPIPGWVSRSGRHERTIWLIALSWSRASPCNASTRRAKVRKTFAVVTV